MAQRFIKMIDKYIGTLTNDADPDIVLASLWRDNTEKDKVKPT